MEIPLIKIHIPQGHQNPRNHNIPITFQLLTNFKSIKDTVLGFLAIFGYFVFTLDGFHAVVVSEGLQDEGFEAEGLVVLRAGLEDL